MGTLEGFPCPAAPRPPPPPRSLPPSGTSGPTPSPPHPLAALAPSRSALRDGTRPARARAKRAGWEGWVVRPEVAWGQSRRAPHAASLHTGYHLRLPFPTPRLRYAPNHDDVNNTPWMQPRGSNRWATSRARPTSARAYRSCSPTSVRSLPWMTSCSRPPIASAHS